MTQIKTYQLNDGSRSSAIGLGTIGHKGAKGINSLITAKENNDYRLIDTSTNYINEGAVGEAVRRTTVPREELIISSKLPGSDHHYDGAIQMIQESLYRLGLDYFDKYLIHWPLPKQDQYVEAWQALIDAQKFGLIKMIGVSNFLTDHLERLIDETGVTPATNQIERHPYFNNKALVKDCWELGIVPEAWSPFGRKIDDVLENETIRKIGEKHGKTPAQIIVRWNIQNDVLVIPKSGSPTHQYDNLDVFDFELSEEDLNAIDDLDKGEPGRVEDQHPNEYEEFV